VAVLVDRIFVRVVPLTGFTNHHQTRNVKFHPENYALESMTVKFSTI